MKNSKLSVLVIEDNEGDFVLIEDYLIEAFNTVQIIRFETFSDFIQIVEEKTTLNYDLLLLDLNLPDLSGMKLIEGVLTSTIQMPIIIMTGYSDLSLAKESLKLGVDDFLIKDEVTAGILHKSIEFAFSRRQYVKQIQLQNEKLKNIAWIQSHVVRAPLSRILGIIHLIETQKENLDDLMFWLSQLKVSSEELDATVRKITEEVQDSRPNKNNSG